MSNSRTIAIDPTDWPRCAKCDTPVEQFCVTDTGDALTLVATCHGETESVTLPDAVWDQVDGGWSIDIIGSAFKERKQ